MGVLAAGCSLHARRRQGGLARALQGGGRPGRRRAKGQVLYPMMNSSTANAIALYGILTSGLSNCASTQSDSCLTLGTRNGNGATAQRRNGATARDGDGGRKQRLAGAAAGSKRHAARGCVTRVRCAGRAATCYRGAAAASTPGRGQAWTTTRCGQRSGLGARGSAGGHTAGTAQQLSGRAHHVPRMCAAGCDLVWPRAHARVFMTIISSAAACTPLTMAWRVRGAINHASYCR